MGLSLIPDVAMVESMGPILHREKEHPGATDAAVARFRRRMLEAVRAFEQGAVPLGFDPSVRYRELRGEAKVVPIDTPWQEVVSYPAEYIFGGAAFHGGWASSPRCWNMPVRP